MTEPESPPHAPPELGFLGGVSQLLSTIVEISYTRLELIFLEIEDGVGGLLGTLIWSIVALFAGAAALFIGSLALIFAFWDTHRVLVSVLIMLVFLGLAGGSLLVIRGRLQRRRPFFSATLAEFAKDRESLKARP